MPVSDRVTSLRRGTLLFFLKFFHPFFQVTKERDGERKRVKLFVEIFRRFMIRYRAIFMGFLRCDFADDLVFMLQDFVNFFLRRVIFLWNFYRIFCARFLRIRRFRKFVGFDRKELDRSFQRKGQRGCFSLCGIFMKFLCYIAILRTFLYYIRFYIVRILHRRKNDLLPYSR